MLFGGLLAAVILLIAWFWFTAERERREAAAAAAINTGKIKFKTIVADGAYEEPASRPATPASLEAVLEAVAKLSPRRMSKGFEIAGAKPGMFVRVTVAAPATVTPSSMVLAYTEAELAIDLAVALVPLFGPIGVDMGDAAWLVVDGSRDVEAIRRSSRSAIAR